MKTSALIISLTFMLTLLFTSCTPRQESAPDSTATEEEITEQGPTQEELREQAAREERKNLKLVQINDALNKYVVDYMNYNSPNTGERPEYAITEQRYNDLTESIEVEFTASWYACVYGMFCETKERHEVTGMITILGNSNELVWSKLIGNQTLINSDNYTDAYNKAVEEGRRNN